MGLRKLTIQRSSSPIWVRPIAMALALRGREATCECA